MTAHGYSLGAALAYRKAFRVAHAQKLHEAMQVGLLYCLPKGLAEPSFLAVRSRQHPLWHDYS